MTAAWALHESLALLVIDAQTSFLDQTPAPVGPVVARLERLLRFAEMTDVPAIATIERPVDEKGGLDRRLLAVLPPGTPVLEKSTFSCLREPAVREALDMLGRTSVVVAGGETDVCVLQTVLDLLAGGFEVRLVEDALFTSEPDPGAAIARMRAAGAIPCTYKTLAYEVTGTVDRTAWPPEWRERLAACPELFPDPEDLPPLS